MHTFNSSANHFMAPLTNDWVAAVIKLLLVCYAGGLAPHLPASVLKMFEHPIVKIGLLFLVTWTGNHDPAVAILIAVALFTSINILAGRKSFDGFASDDDE